MFKLYPEVEEVIIYGSHAKGNYRTGSDIDLTLIGSALDYNILSEINQAIDDLNTPYLFDISIFQNLNAPDLEAHIERIGQFFIRKIKFI